jgi:hypothetical protein
MSPTSDSPGAVRAALAVSGAAVFSIAAAPSTVAIVAGEGGLLGLAIAIAAGIVAVGGAWRRSALLLLAGFPWLALGALLATPEIALAAITTPSGTLSLAVSLLAWVTAAASFTLRVEPTPCAARPLGIEPTSVATFGSGGHRVALALVMLVPLTTFAFVERTAFFTAKASALVVFVVATAIFAASISLWLAGVGPSVGGAWDDLLHELGWRRIVGARAARVQIVLLVVSLAAAAAAGGTLFVMLRAG